MKLNYEVKLNGEIYSLEELLSVMKVNNNNLLILIYQEVEGYEKHINIVINLK